MKIIDLLNKISNEEEVPKYIGCFNKITGYPFIFMVCKENIIYKLNYEEIGLNDEIEIIEDCPNNLKKINWKEKESLAGNFTEKQKMEILARRSEKLKKSLNELIDYINKLESEKQNETK